MTSASTNDMPAIEQAFSSTAPPFFLHRGLASPQALLEVLLEFLPGKRTGGSEEAVRQTFTSKHRADLRSRGRY